MNIIRMSGFILFLAGMLKGIELVGGGIQTSIGLFLLTVTVIWAELYWGTYLLLIEESNPLVRKVALLAGILFSAFAALQVINIVNGASSCGCFGSVQIDPRIVAIVDLSCSALLIFYYFTLPKSMESTALKSTGDKLRRQIRLYLLNPLNLVGALFIVIACQIPSPVTAIEEKSALEIGDFFKPVYRIDKTIVGKSLPLDALLKNKTAVQNYSAGVWVVCFIRNGCKSCELLKLKLDALQNGTVVAPDNQRFLVIELDSTASTGNEDSSRGELVSYEKANDFYRWAIAPPLCFRMADCIVVSASKDGNF